MQLDCRYEQARRAVLRMFIDELKLLDHFAALRRFVLMHAGELMDCLCTQLHQAAQTANGWQSPQALHLCLQTALKVTGRDQDPYAKHLSITLGRRDAVKMAPGGQPATAAAAAPVAELQDVRLAYTVEWPLNIVLSEVALQSYAKVFSLLWQQKLVALALQKLWKHLDSSFREVRNAELHELLRFRWEMQHFIGILQDYLISQVRIHSFPSLGMRICLAAVL